MRVALALTLTALVVVSGCKNEAPSGAGSTTASADAGRSATPGPATVQGLPARDLKGTALAGLTITVPASATIEPNGRDGKGASLTVGDYSLNVELGRLFGGDPLKTKPDPKKYATDMLKPKKFVVDGPDGVICEFEDRKLKGFFLYRVVDVPGGFVTCTSTFAKSPQTAAQATDAFAMCGSIKKK